MKKLIFAGFILVSSFSAMANLSTACLKKDIVCKADSFMVQLSSDHKTLTIVRANGYRQSYEVKGEMGDVSVSFSAKNGYPDLRLGDDGDSIFFARNLNGVSLKCPQGNDNDCSDQIANVDN